MKRLCIYVVYDNEKIIDNYIADVLFELKQNCEFLIVVCNFENAFKGQEYIEKYADKIKYRENIGFDFGAYKDVLCELFAEDTLKYYDELVLCNDTFFSTSYSFDEMFFKMESQKCDFWGITRHRKNIAANVRATHIQSYFLVFRKNVFLSSCFEMYWNNIEYYSSAELLVYYGEIGLTEYFKNYGFSYMVYTDLWDLPFLKDFDDNPYIEYPYELLKDARLPVLKVKDLSWAPYLRPSTVEAVYFLKNKLNMDIASIVSHTERIRNNKLGNVWIDFKHLEQFISKYSKIYIYGMGNWGHIVSKYFEIKGMSFVSFLETNPRDLTKSKKLDEIQIDDNVGIIVAQMKKTIAQEICTLCLEYGLGNDQIFMPIFN